QQLKAGQITRTQVALDLLTGEEYRALLTNALYDAFLGRQPRVEERAIQVKFLDGGGTIDRLRARLLGSTENFSHRGRETNDGFLDALYADVLGRAIDSVTRTYFDYLLTHGTTREQVAYTVLTSVEAQTKLVQGYYRRFLGRSATAAEA